jgi:hypothetical protein
LAWWHLPAPPWPRRIAITGLCIAVAIVGGTLAALALRLLSASKTGALFKPPLMLAPEIAALTGLFIAGLASGVDPVGWRGFLVRVSIAVACALVSGLWTKLLVDCLIGESQSVVGLVDRVTRSTVDSVDFALSASRAACLSMALIAALALGRARDSHSPVCDLGRASDNTDASPGQRRSPQ